VAGGTREKKTIQHADRILSLLVCILQIHIDSILVKNDNVVELRLHLGIRVGKEVFGLAL
jgi:hypothetical protein